MKCSYGEISGGPGGDGNARLGLGRHLLPWACKSVGVNVGGDVFGGFILGGTENVKGLTINMNITLGPLGVTTFSNPSTGEFIGMTFGVGPAALPFQASLTGSLTGTFTLRDLLAKLRNPDRAPPSKKK